MSIRSILALSAFVFVSLAENADARRTCRVVYPERPRNAPRVAHLFDGKTSKLVTLPSMNLSEVIELPDGNLTLAMTSKQVVDPTQLPADTPKLQIPEQIRDFYIIVSSNPKNNVIPVTMNLVASGRSDLEPGQTLWFNLTEHRIIAKMGEQVVNVPPKGKNISNNPIQESGYYLARIAYQANGTGAVAPITEQQWWHDTNSRHLGFVATTGGKLPKLYYYRDFRLSAAERKAIAEADPKDLKPVIEEAPSRPENLVPEELRGDDFPEEETVEDED